MAWTDLRLLSPGHLDSSTSPASASTLSSHLLLFPLPKTNGLMKVYANLKIKGEEINTLQNFPSKLTGHNQWSQSTEVSWIEGRWIEGRWPNSHIQGALNTKTHLYADVPAARYFQQGTSNTSLLLPKQGFQQNQTAHIQSGVEWGQSSNVFCLHFSNKTPVELNQCRPEAAAVLELAIVLCLTFQGPNPTLTEVNMTPTHFNGA